MAKPDKPDNEITLNISTSNGVFTASFAKTAKVSDIIEAAIVAKNLDRSDKFEVFKGDEALEPVERTLVSFHLVDGDELLLSATGSGV
jgi:hypothetical protein